MATLGAKPLHPPPPEPTPEPAPTAEQAAEQAAQQDAEQAAEQQWNAELDSHLAHLKSLALDPNSEHFAPDMLDALNLVDHHVGGSSERITELRDRVQKGIAAKARAALQEHLEWAETSFPPGVDRVGAQLHGLGLYVDDLDPEIDAATIEIARRLLPSVDHD